MEKLGDDPGRVQGTFVPAYSLIIANQHRVFGGVGRIAVEATPCPPAEGLLWAHESSRFEVTKHVFVMASYGIRE